MKSNHRFKCTASQLTFKNYRSIDFNFIVIFNGFYDQAYHPRKCFSDFVFSVVFFSSVNKLFFYFFSLSSFQNNKNAIRKIVNIDETEGYR